MLKLLKIFILITFIISCKSEDQKTNRIQESKTDKIQELKTLSSELINLFPKETTSISSFNKSNKELSKILNKEIILSINEKFNRKKNLELFDLILNISKKVTKDNFFNPSSSYIFNTENNLAFIFKTKETLKKKEISNYIYKLLSDSKISHTVSKDKEQVLININEKDFILKSFDNYIKITNEDENILKYPEGLDLKNTYYKDLNKFKLKRDTIITTWAHMNSTLIKHKSISLISELYSINPIKYKLYPLTEYLNDFDFSKYIFKNKTKISNNSILNINTNLQLLSFLEKHKELKEKIEFDEEENEFMKNAKDFSFSINKSDSFFPKFELITNLKSNYNSNNFILNLFEEMGLSKDMWKNEKMDKSEIKSLTTPFGINLFFSQIKDKLYISNSKEIFNKKSNDTDKKKFSKGFSKRLESKSLLSAYFNLDNIFIVLNQLRFFGDVNFIYSLGQIYPNLLLNISSDESNNNLPYIEIVSE